MKYYDELSLKKPQNSKTITSNKKSQEKPTPTRNPPVFNILKCKIFI